MANFPYRLKQYPTTLLPEEDIIKTPFYFIFYISSLDNF